MSAAGQDAVVEAMGELMAAWRLPRATGRVYGHLILRDAASTSEELRDALRLSAGAVSTAVRALEAWGLVRTTPRPRTRRRMIEAAGGFEHLLAASHERTRMLIHVLEEARAATDGPVADERLAGITRLFADYVDAGERVLRDAGRAATGAGAP